MDVLERRYQTYLKKAVIFCSAKHLLAIIAENNNALRIANQHKPKKASHNNRLLFLLMKCDARAD